MLLLASRVCPADAAGRILDIRPSDIDAAGDTWPIGPGTFEGARRIFPGVKKATDVREAIRVLQRVLGGGKRHVAFVTVSALLCFWKRNEDGSLAWAAPETKRKRAVAAPNAKRLRNAV